MLSRVREKKAINRNKSLLMLTGFSCNNNCVVCSVKSREQFYPDRSLEELILELAKKREEGFDHVEFTGGEPTIRRDIVLLVEAAKKLGYKKIALSTNGRLFRYPKFRDQIIEAGLNKITFSLLSHEQKIHDSITRTRGSYDEVIAGIKSMVGDSNIHVNISSVICRFNYKDLKKFGQFVQQLGVKQWYLLDLIPDGNAKKFYDSLSVPLPVLSRELNNLIALSRGFLEFGFFDFPLCLFSPQARSLNNICLVNAKMRSQTTQQVGYNPKRIRRQPGGNFEDSYRINVDICKKCKYYKECGGIWREYLQKYGDKEIAFFAKKNKCLSGAVE